MVNRVEAAQTTFRQAIIIHPKYNSDYLGE